MMATTDQAVVSACPHCGKGISIPWAMLGSSVQCPHCHGPFVASSTPNDPRNVSVLERRYHFQCLRCGSVLEARLSQAGQSGKCPTCGAMFRIPLVDPQTGLASNNADPGSDGQDPTPLHAYAAAGTEAPQIIRHEDDRLEIQCRRCGTRSPITVNNCASCGIPFTLEGLEQVARPAGSDGEGGLCVLAALSIPLSFCGGIGALAAVGVLIVVALRRSRGRAFTGVGIASALMSGLSIIIAVAIWLMM